MPDSEPTEDGQTPFDKLNLPKRNGDFHQNLRALYNEVVLAGHDFTEITHQALPLDEDFEDQKYRDVALKRSYILCSLTQDWSLTKIANNNNRTYSETFALRAIKTVENYWKTTIQRQSLKEPA